MLKLFYSSSSQHKTAPSPQGHRFLSIVPRSSHVRREVIQHNTRGRRDSEGVCVRV